MTEMATANEHRIDDAQAFLMGELDKRISSFRSRRDFYRRGSFSFVIFASFLTAVTTLLIGLGEIYKQTILSIFALGTSASLSVLTAWDAFYGHRQRWIESNETLMRLYKLKSDIAFELTLQGSPLPEEHLRGYYNEYSQVLNDSNAQWKATRSRSQPPAGAN
jgi:hypothetical protein